MQDAAKRLTQYSMYGSKPHTKVSTKTKRGFLDEVQGAEPERTEKASIQMKCEAAASA